MFRAASDDDIDVYTDTVTGFLRKCIEDVVPTKTIRTYPNQKLWINSDIHTALSARTSAFHSGNADDYKQTSYALRKTIKTAKRQNKGTIGALFTTSNYLDMWQGLHNITDYKDRKHPTTNTSTSLPDELNTFYAHFEVSGSSHTQSAPAAETAEARPLSVFVADITKKVKKDHS